VARLADRPVVRRAITLIDGSFWLFYLAMAIVAVLGSTRPSGVGWKIAGGIVGVIAVFELVGAFFVRAATGRWPGQSSEPTPTK
jgi:hypothetical protein